MNEPRTSKPACHLRRWGRLVAYLCFACRTDPAWPAQDIPAATQQVTVSEDSENFTLNNGLVTSRIEKRTGTLVSLSYEGIEFLAQGERGANGGYWSSVGRGRPGSGSAAIVRIDP